MRLILASQSPRRAALLRQLQIAFSVKPASIDESVQRHESAGDYVTRLAQQKAEKIWTGSGKTRPVLGADTVVYAQGQILGKPEIKEDALDMLRVLSGTWHKVLTAVALMHGGGLDTCLVSTEVSFKPLSEAEMNWYWASGEPEDKAGSYAIQGLAGRFVREIKGSYTAVVGLPLFETSQLLEKIGIKPYEC